MHFFKLSGAGLLLLVGFWCLGRTVETGLNQDSGLVDRRETMTAGLLIGLPVTALGGWLIWHDRQQQQRQQQERIGQLTLSDIRLPLTGLQLSLSEWVTPYEIVNPQTSRKQGKKEK